MFSKKFFPGAVGFFFPQIFYKLSLHMTQNTVLTRLHGNLPLCSTLPGPMRNWEEAATVQFRCQHAGHKL